ncbi:DegT/DnrJ/EryC1/StrS family aminotransferase [Echinicola soli]|uniref:DegT/DnrJ/EryC1/StrS family aminotransferase n=1 Tax=Echinicola soli TaxID=2591634 RepID=A0A514CN54_9BACT|nr:DegT/DnrJ/EryC1/StrS family aminotransferase [Echinicola soli]QDH81249.1 DegT/DnrJ/EryC1/StrS family aminotransferase [Echinicola soli]
MAKIQMVDLKTQYEKIKGEVNAGIQEVIDNSAFINGPQVKAFASELADYNKVKYTITCGNGTDALQIAMMTFDFQPGDEVIVPAFTYIATVEVIALLKLKPVFIDVTNDTFQMDIDQLNAKISHKTVAIIPVHLFGQCSNMDTILEVAREYNLKVIEDTAQAIGAEYTFKNKSKRMAGTMGDIGITSFFPSKNLGCFGDGGAIFTNDDLLAQKLRMIANHGQKQKYYHDSIGVNSRLDTLQAAILRVKLKYLDEYSSARNEVARKYDTAFEGHTNIISPSRVQNSTHVFHQYTLKIEGADRDDLKNYLSEKGVPSMVYYPVPVHLQNAYRNYGYVEGDFPVAESLCKKVLSLPIHTEMVDEDQKFIIETIKNYF